MAAEREVLVRLKGDASDLIRASNQGSDALRGVGKAGKTGGEEANKGISNGAKLLGAAVVAGVGLAAKSMLSLGISYETSLNQLQAVSGSTDAEMVKIGASARALGNDLDLPAASATDAASAMLELTKGGLSVQQSMEAAKGTLQLAAAAQIDGAQAAQIQSAALNTFGLEASDAGRVADILANAANAASGEITDFAQGMAQSGLAAKSLGIPLEDTATVLGIFANNGLAGSDAGTSFKTMLLSLENPTLKSQEALDALGITVYDAQGKFVGMEAITGQLTEAKKRLSLQEFNTAAATAFGSDAVRAAISLAESGPAGFDAMSEAIGRQGGAAAVAAANTKGLQGAMGLVRNAVEEAALSLYDELSPALEIVTRGLADQVPILAAGLVPALGEAGRSIAGLVEALAPLIVSLANSLAPAITIGSSAIETLINVMTPVIEAIGFVLDGISALPAPFGVAATAILAVTLLRGPLLGLTTSATAGFASIKAQVIAATAGVSGFAAASGLAALAGTKLLALLGGPIGLAIVAITTGFALFSDGQSDSARAAESNADAIDSLGGALKRTNGVVDESVRATALASVQTAAWGRDQQDLTGFLDEQGVTLADLIDSQVGVAGASDKITAAYERQKAALKAVIDQGTSSDGQGGTIQTSGAEEAELALRVLEEQRVAQLGLAEATDKANLANSQAAAAIARTAGAADDSSGAFLRADQATLPYATSLANAGDAADGYGTSAENAIDPTERMKASLDENKSAAQGVETAYNFLIAALDAAAGRAPDVERANRAAAGSLREYAEQLRAQPQALRDVQDATDGITEANVANEQALADLAEAQAKNTDETYSAEQKARDITTAQLSANDAARGLAEANDTLADANANVAAAGDKLFESGTQVFGATVQQAQAAYNAAVANGNLTGAMGSAKSAAQQMRDQFVSANTEIYGSKEAAEQAADALGLIPTDIAVAIDVNTNTSAAEARINSFIFDQNQKSIYIQANIAGGGTGDTRNANGGIHQAGQGKVFENGGITYAANGLIRQPMLKIGGPSITWGEPETDWEAYISGKPSARDRNQVIMGMTADKLGGTYFPPGKNFADGGINDGIQSGAFSARDYFSLAGSAASGAPIHKHYHGTVENYGPEAMGLDSLQRMLVELERRN